MIIAARQAGGRLAEHDALLIIMAWHHGFRASELIALRWDQIDLKAGTQHVSNRHLHRPMSLPRSMAGR
jgi:type 1 fimbriae regulatory protein FimB/type 1 fimbriae regulatory protein FimE